MLVRAFASLVLSLFALSVAPAAHAASGGDKPEGDGASERQMVSPNVVTPVVRDGKLVNYLFVTVRVDLSPKANVMKVRDRAHFLRDALLKAAHRNALGDPAREDKLNTPAAVAAFKIAAQQALGAANVKSVSIDGVDSLKRR